MPSNEQINTWLTCPLEDLARTAAAYEPAPDGIFQNVKAVIEARAAIESAKASEAARDSAKWAKWTAFGTLMLALSTVTLAIVTAIVK